MLWGLLIGALLAFALAFSSHSAGWMAFGILIGFGCAIAAGLMFIDRHLRASSRPEHMTDREVQALRCTIRKPAAPQPQLPPTAPR